MTSAGGFEVIVRGVPERDRDRRLDSLLSQYGDVIVDKRWERDRAVVVFSDADTADRFVRSHDQFPYVGSVLRVSRPDAPKKSMASATARTGHASAADPASASRPKADRPVNPRSAKCGNDHRRAAPYHFIPVHPDACVTAEPVLHDRFEPRAWSGELLVSLRALTPLLAANDQYDFAPFVEGKVNSQQLKDFDDGFGRADDGPAHLRLGKNGRLTCQAAMTEDGRKRLLALLGKDRVWRENIRQLYERSQGPMEAIVRQYHQLMLCRSAANHPVDPDKKILEPLALPACDQKQTIGPVMVSGAALKGSLRHSLAALFASPMERVAERTFSYRPNVTFAGRKPIPALVVGGGGKTKEGKANPVRVIEVTLNDLCYVQPAAMSALPTNLHQRLVELEGQEPQQRQEEYASNKARQALCLTSAEVSAMEKKHLRLSFSNILKTGRRREDLSSLVDRLPVVNPNGIDLKGRLNRKFRDLNPDSNKSPDGYRFLLVNVSRSKTGTLDEKQLEEFYGTLEHLASGESGHLRDHPLVQKRKEDQSDFTHLAGRLSFNTAVEYVQDKTDAERFLNDQYGFLVPLRPLGSPKPSAVEHYLTQDYQRVGDRLDDGILCTYGDTFDDPSAGNLRGRKFYLHQPDAARIDEGYNHCFELGVADPNPEYWGDTHVSGQPKQRKKDWRMEEDRGDKRDSGMIHSMQAAIGRFVSRPGNEFRTTLRFSNLADWELGAVLLVLAPTVKTVRFFAKKLGAPGQPVLEWLDKHQAQATESAPLLAHKLGHGRPLGMGSVRYTIDRVRRICAQYPADAAAGPACVAAVDVSRKDKTDKKDNPDGEDNPDEVDKLTNDNLKALAAFVKEALPREGQLAAWVNEVFLPWLAIHRYAGRQRYDYPRDIPRKPRDDTPSGRPPYDETIYSYHTNLRQKHALGRKNADNAKGQNRRDLYGLKDA